MTEEKPNDAQLLAEECSKTLKQADFSQMFAHQEKESAIISEIMHKKYTRIDEAGLDYRRTCDLPISKTSVQRNPPLEVDDDKLVVEHDGCGA